MDSERVACPLCGWWRTLEYGMTAAGTQREVRFDKVDPAKSPLYRKEHLQGHGREKGKSIIELVEAKGILGLDPRLLQQIRIQCHRILDVVEGRTSALPVAIKPPPPMAEVTPAPAKKETTKKKKPAAEKKEFTPAKPKAPKEPVQPSEGSFGVADTYQDKEDADIDLAKMKRLTPEFDWKIVETKEKGKPVFQLWYYAKPEPVKGKAITEQKPAAAEKTKVKPVKEPPAKAKVTSKPVSPPPLENETYSSKEIEDAQSILSQMQTVLNEEKKTDSLKKLRKLIDQSNEDMFEGLDDVESAIEEYESVEKKGQTPEEYAEAKSDAFAEIQTAIDNTELIEEVQAIIKKAKKKK